MAVISFERAQELNFSLPLVNLKITKKNIYEAYGEILAVDIHCQKPLPAFDNSAMDGYGLKICDLKKNIKIKSTILAGENASDVEISEGECVKVMTGAMLAKGVEVVVPFENVQVENGFIKILGDFAKGDNIRYKGEEKHIGANIAKKGDRLTHGLIGLIASQGISTIEVYEKLKIAVYSSGDEVIEPTEIAKEYQIYNVNAVCIVSLLKSYGYNAEYLGILKDNPQILEDAIRAFQHYDVVITSGGASVGEADFLETSLKACGANIRYHGVNIKPGKAMMSATLGDTLIYALPGNPLSGVVNLTVIVIAAITRLQGASKFYPKPIIAKLKTPIKLKKGRLNMILGKYNNGEFEAYKGGKYGSNTISTIAECDSIAIIGEKVSQLEGSIRILPYVMEFSDTIFEIINE